MHADIEIGCSRGCNCFIENSREIKKLSLVFKWKIVPTERYDMTWWKSCLLARIFSYWDSLASMLLLIAMHQKRPYISPIRGVAIIFWNVFFCNRKFKGNCELLDGTTCTVPILLRDMHYLKTGKINFTPHEQNTSPESKAANWKWKRGHLLGEKFLCYFLEQQLILKLRHL